MPKLSGDTLLKRAIPRAIDDRESFLDAIGDSNPDAASDQEAIANLKALKGITISKMTKEQRNTAFSAFVWAEQWHEGVAHAHHFIGSIAQQAHKELRLLRDYRFANMGMTKLESAMRNTELMDMRDAFKRCIANGNHVGPGKVR